MYLPSAFRFGVLLVLHHALLVAGADFAYIQGTITTATADWLSIKTTVQSINTVTDFPLYATNMGNYKAMENKLVALNDKMATWNAEIPGSVVSATEATAIATSFQTLINEMSLSLSAITSKSGLFSTTPVVGQPIVSALDAILYSFVTYSINIRTLSQGLSSQLSPALPPVYSLLLSAPNKYKGGVC
ncbi:hypothetical protein V8F20_008551 [Naviculisporaceae sp. PSN 640]